MRRSIAVLLLAVSSAVVGSAGAQIGAVYDCAEAERVGIDWQNDNTSATGFRAGTFTMKIVSPTLRHISPTSDSFAQGQAATCKPVGEDDALVRCLAGAQIWLFRGKAFTSAYLLGGPGVAATPGDHRITVSHGTCIRRMP